MGTNKPKAHELAVDWWNSDQGIKSRIRGHAICDSCNAQISEGQGYLCNPAVVGASGLPAGMFNSPDLVCESCFDRKSYEPWNPGGAARMTEEAQAALDFLASPVKQVGISRPEDPELQEQIRRIKKAEKNLLFLWLISIPVAIFVSLFKDSFGEYRDNLIMVILAGAVSLAYIFYLVYPDC